MSHKTRNRTIAQAHYFGSTREQLAERFGLTPRRISQIIAAERLNAAPTRRDAFRALSVRNRGRPRDPQLAALGNDAPFYAYLRRTMGAAYARRAMGLDQAA